MKDEVGERGASGTEGGGASEGSSIGRYLARQRELRGISIEELCARTKIPRRNIERLESGALDGQPDGFVRGFVRTIAQALGLDADEAVMRLMREPEAEEGQPVGGDHRARRYRIGAAAAGLLILALLGGAVLRWLGRSEPQESPAATDPGVTYRVDVVRDLARDAKARPPAAAPGDPEAGPDTGPPSAP